MAFEVKSIDESSALEHHGVMGMKWGVRKDGKPQGYQAPKGYKSRKQAKKSIRKAAKAYRKKTGEANTTGANMAKVDKQIANAQNSDEQIKKLTKERDEASARLDEGYEEVSRKQQREDNAARKSEEARIIYDEVSKNGTASQQLNARRDYKKAREEHEDAVEKRIQAENEVDERRIKYDQADGDLSDRRRSIASQFREEQLNAAVKDLGFEDVSKGREVLKEYNLEAYALNPSWSMRIWANGVRE